MWQMGSDHLGSDHLGSDHLGSDHLGSDHLGSDHRGSDPEWSDPEWSDPTAPAAPGRLLGFENPGVRIRALTPRVHSAGAITASD